MFKKKNVQEVNSIDLLRNKCLEIKQQMNNTRTTINAYELNIKRNLEQVKRNANNPVYIKTIKPIIAMSLKKKKMMEKYYAILQACDSVAEAKLLEAKIGGDIFDNNFIKGIDTLLSNSLNGIEAITDASRVEDLETSFDIYSSMMAGDRVDGEVDAIIDSILGQVKTDNPEVAQKSDFVKEMQNILKG